MLVGETDKRVVFWVGHSRGSPMRANVGKTVARWGRDRVKTKLVKGYWSVGRASHEGLLGPVVRACGGVGKAGSERETK
ncbi:hypothetical protein Sm713_79010 [Streptomyces sp. TS71-3]|nr:hypothetical protein Sm713_79010 [Streptomyces sp. TS71-3]